MGLKWANNRGHGLTSCQEFDSSTPGSCQDFDNSAPGSCQKNAYSGSGFWQKFAYSPFPGPALALLPGIKMPTRPGLPRIIMRETAFSRPCFPPLPALPVPVPVGLAYELHRASTSGGHVT